MTEDEMARWHHRLDGRECEQALGDAEGQESLTCCSPGGLKKSNVTQQLNNTTTIIYANKFGNLGDWGTKLQKTLTYLPQIY